MAEASERALAVFVEFVEVFQCVCVCNASAMRSHPTFVDFAQINGGDRPTG
jgi:hypothetical protein